MTPQAMVRGKLGRGFWVLGNILMLGWMYSAGAGQEFNVSGISVECRHSIQDARRIELTLTRGDTTEIAVLDHDLCRWGFSNDTLKVDCGGRGPLPEQEVILSAMRIQMGSGKGWLLGAALGFFGSSVIAGIVTSGQGQQPAFGIISLGGSLVGAVIGSRLEGRSRDWRECYRRVEGTNSD